MVERYRRVLPVSSTSHQCSVIQTVRQRLSLLLSKYTNKQIYKYNEQCSVIQTVRQRLSLPKVYKYTNIQICNDRNIEIYKYTNIQICHYYVQYLYIVQHLTNARSYKLSDSGLICSKSKHYSCLGDYSIF